MQESSLVWISTLRGNLDSVMFFWLPLLIAEGTSSFRRREQRRQAMGTGRRWGQAGLRNRFDLAINFQNKGSTTLDRQLIV